MDRQERVFDPEETLRVAIKAAQTRFWTALPCIVQSFDPDANTITAQPAINGMQLDPTTGLYSPVQMPLLTDCPVLWQGGGMVTATFPIAEGDECLIIFSARAIDGWFSLGGIQNPTSTRMHNLSDGFALVGVRSQPRVFNVDTENACLISDDGSTFVKLNPAGQTVAITAPQGINLNGVTIDKNGNVKCPATVTATTDVIAGGNKVSLVNHIHNVPLVQPGTATVPTVKPT